MVNKKLLQFPAGKTDLQKRYVNKSKVRSQKSKNEIPPFLLYSFDF